VPPLLFLFDMYSLNTLSESLTLSEMWAADAPDAEQIHFWRSML